MNTIGAILEFFNNLAKMLFKYLDEQAVRRREMAEQKRKDAAADRTREQELSDLNADIWELEQ